MFTDTQINDNKSIQSLLSFQGNCNGKTNDKSQLKRVLNFRATKQFLGFQICARMEGATKALQPQN